MVRGLSAFAPFVSTRGVARGSFVARQVEPVLALASPREGRLLHAVLLLQLALTPPEAQHAERLVHASIRDFDLGNFEQALGEAEQAYGLDPLPQILFNIAQCHRALKHWEKAAFFYQRYLSKLPNAPNRPTVEDLLTEVTYRAKVEALPASKPQPAVVVAVPPPAAPVTREESVPPAALEPGTDKSIGPSRSHTAAYVLGSVAIASLGAAIVGIVYVESFEAVLGRLNGTPVEKYAAWQTDHATATSDKPLAQDFMWIGGAAGAVALGTGTAAVFTW
jgi:tetratricopeptide (TPR) repeat protein